MTWSFAPDRPIYLQLQEQIKLSIVSGLHPPGGKLPAVRDLAEAAAVNPNTVQRALTELEREGLVHTQRTSGRFVTEDKNVIEKTKTGLAMELAESFLSKMAALGYDVGETLALIEFKTGAVCAAQIATNSELRVQNSGPKDAGCVTVDREGGGNHNVDS